VIVEFSLLVETINVKWLKKGTAQISNKAVVEVRSVCHYEKHDWNRTQLLKGFRVGFEDLINQVKWMTIFCH